VSMYKCSVSVQTVLNDWLTAPPNTFCAKPTSKAAADKV